MHLHQVFPEREGLRVEVGSGVCTPVKVTVNSSLATSGINDQLRVYESECIGGCDTVSEEEPLFGGELGGGGLTLEKAISKSN